MSNFCRCLDFAMINASILLSPLMTSDQFHPDRLRYSSLDAYVYNVALSSVYSVHIQGLPFGFDLMYLALADRNMQVRFGFKVFWEF